MSVSPVETNNPVPRTSALRRPINVSFYVFFPAGGIGRYTNELVRAVANYSELSVEVVCSPDYKWKSDPNYPAWMGLRSISHPMPILRRFRFLLGQFVNPVRCIKHAIETGADIVHFSNVNPLSFPYWKRQLKASGVQTVISVHDVKRRKGIINKHWEKRQLKAIYRFADALFVHSEHQANELMAFAGVREDKIHIVPHGPYAHSRPFHSPNEARAILGLPTEKQVALFFGQIRDDKNLDRFIEALALSTSKPCLVVAGRGGGRHRDVEYYRQHAKRVGVDHLVTFMPRFIPDEEVSTLFTAADWVVLPYRNTFTSQSGVLNVAAYYERPVLVSSAPVLQETVKMCDIGVACTGDTVVELAEGIDRICRRVHEGHQHQFHEYQNRFNWQENARRTLEVYQRLIR